MASSAEEVLDQLEWRLHRIEHIIQGTEIGDGIASTSTNESRVNLQQRLQNIEKKFASLINTSPLVADLLRLCMFMHLVTTLLVLNPATGDEHPSKAPDASEDRGLESISTSDKATIVLASSTTIQAAQSRLSSLEGLKLEDASTLLPLATMQRELSFARARQESQQRELAELQARTARVFAQWYADSVVREGERLAEWEQRMLAMERIIRRRKLAQQQDTY